LPYPSTIRVIVLAAPRVAGAVSTSLYTLHQAEKIRRFRRRGMPAAGVRTT
jgi:hypothetical protein